MPIPDGARSVTYEVRASGTDHEGEMTEVSVSVSSVLWDPARREDADAAARSGAEALRGLMATQLPDHTIRASRSYDCVVRGSQWPVADEAQTLPAPPEEVPDGDPAVR